MGAFIAGIAVRGATQDDIANLYRVEKTSHAAYISPARNGWINVYDSRCDCQDEDVIAEIATRISRGTNCPSLAFVVHDSDLAICWLFSGGGDLISSFSLGIEAERIAEFKGVPDSPRPSATYVVNWRRYSELVWMRRSCPSLFHAEQFSPRTF